METWTTDVRQVAQIPLFELELVPNTVTVVSHQHQHQPDATPPLCFFNRVTPLHAVWNFSAPSGQVPPFLPNTVVDQPDVQVMSLTVGVCIDWNRNHMTMVSVWNIVNVNRNCIPMNFPRSGLSRCFPIHKKSVKEFPGSESLSLLSYTMFPLIYSVT